jgi:hypothetical protein
MNDLDWFKAFCLAALGLVLGPLASIGFLYLYSELTWPRGEAAVGASMAYLGTLPIAFVFGLIVGPILGFIWGLAGDRIKDLLYEAAAMLFRLFRR